MLNPSENARQSADASATNLMRRATMARLLARAPAMSAPPPSIAETSATTCDTLEIEPTTSSGEGMANAGGALSRKTAAAPQTLMNGDNANRTNRNPVTTSASSPTSTPSRRRAEASRSRAHAGLYHHWTPLSLNIASDLTTNE